MDGAYPFEDSLGREAVVRRAPAWVSTPDGIDGWPWEGAVLSHLYGLRSDTRRRRYQVTGRGLFSGTFLLFGLHVSPAKET